MNTHLLSIARQRAQDENLPYAGACTPAETWSIIQDDPQTILIDVRTNAERDWVGKVAIPENQHKAVQWNLYPGGIPNPDFLNQLLTQVTEKDTVLLFLCRSGVRSHHAAILATENGFTNCFNILEGFEGDKNAQGYRKSSNGWCKTGLPWIGA